MPDWVDWLSRLVQRSSRGDSRGRHLRTRARRCVCGARRTSKLQFGMISIFICIFGILIYYQCGIVTQLLALGRNVSAELFIGGLGRGPIANLPRLDKIAIGHPIEVDLAALVVDWVAN